MSACSADPEKEPRGSYTLNKYTESYVLSVWDHKATVECVRRIFRRGVKWKQRMITVARKQNPKESLEKNV